MIRHSALATLAISVSLIACGGGGGAGSSPSPITRPSGIQSTSSAASRPGTTTPGPVGDATPSPTAPPSQAATAPGSALATMDFTSGWSQLEIAAGPSAREDHTWTVAGDDGVAYLFGGRAQSGPSDELWQFDLAAATWSQVEPTNSGPEARFGHTATWVPDVGLVIWSGQGTTGFFDDIWRFDPSANRWEQLPSSGAVPSARYGS